MAALSHLLIFLSLNLIYVVICENIITTDEQDVGENEDHINFLETNWLRLEKSERSGIMGYAPNLCRSFAEVAHRRPVQQYVPKCMKDGTFHPLQCDLKRIQCWCVDTDGIRAGPKYFIYDNKVPECYREPRIKQANIRTGGLMASGAPAWLPSILTNTLLVLLMALWLR